MRYHVSVDGETYQVDLLERNGGLVAALDGRELLVDFRRVRGRACYSLLLDGSSYPLSFEARADGLSVTVGEESYLFRVEDERTRAARAISGGRGSRDKSKVLLSVMPGIVREVRVSPGDAVKAGEALLILEAMKMENEIRTVMDGVVKSVHVEANATVNKGDALVTLQ